MALQKRTGEKLEKIFKDLHKELLKGDFKQVLSSDPGKFIYNEEKDEYWYIVDVKNGDDKFVFCSDGTWSGGYFFKRIPMKYHYDYLLSYFDIVSEFLLGYLLFYIPYNSVTYCAIKDTIYQSVNKISENNYREIKQSLKKIYDANEKINKKILKINDNELLYIKVINLFKKLKPFIDERLGEFFSNISFNVNEGDQVKPYTQTIFHLLQWESKNNSFDLYYMPEFNTLNSQIKLPRFKTTAKEAKPILEKIFDDSDKYTIECSGNGEDRIFSITVKHNLDINKTISNNEAIFEKEFEENYRLAFEAQNMFAKLSGLEEPNNKIATLSQDEPQSSEFQFFVPKTYQPFNTFCQEIHRQLYNGILKNIVEPPSPEKIYVRDPDNKSFSFYEMEMKGTINSFDIMHDTEEKALCFMFTGDRFSQKQSDCKDALEDLIVKFKNEYLSYEMSGKGKNGIFSVVLCAKEDILLKDYASIQITEALKEIEFLYNVARKASNKIQEIAGIKPDIEEDKVIENVQNTTNHIVSMRSDEDRRVEYPKEIHTNESGGNENEGGFADTLKNTFKGLKGFFNRSASNVPDIESGSQSEKTNSVPQNVNSPTTMSHEPQEEALTELQRNGLAELCRKLHESLKIDDRFDEFLAPISIPLQLINHPDNDNLLIYCIPTVEDKGQISISYVVHKDKLKLGVSSQYPKEYENNFSSNFGFYNQDLKQKYKLMYKDNAIYCFYSTIINKDNLERCSFEELQKILTEMVEEYIEAKKLTEQDWS